MKSTVVSRIEMPALSEGDTARSPKLGERLDLIEHVNVKLDVVVGQAVLPVDRLFALSMGDVVPLDAPVDTPMEIRLNGKLIARGELLAVGEQFGIRITDIIS
ncbi:MAG: FliM/FliN family flagellar motor switch protein [Steroidobacter sp.]